MRKRLAAYCITALFGNKIYIFLESEELQLHD